MEAIITALSFNPLEIEIGLSGNFWKKCEAAGIATVLDFCHSK